MSGIGSIGGNTGLPGLDHTDAATTASPASPAAPTTLATPSLAASATLRAVLAGRATIAYGARDHDAAKLVQQGLVDLGFLAASPGADGLFGNASVAAVKKLQAAAGLHADGIVGKDTLHALDERLAAHGGPSPSPSPTPTPTPTPSPIPPGGVISGNLDVIRGSDPDYDLDSDTLYVTGEGSFHSGINREIYTAGYLPRTDGPLNKPMGTPEAASKVLSAADNAMNTTKSPVERFDEAMKRATGTAGGLTARYATEGKQPDAKPWWGFCDRWSYNALDPVVATHVDKPIQLGGVYFSTAELRGLASFLGRADEGSRDLFKKDVTPLDLEKATTMYLRTNGSGFVSSIWNNAKHPGDYEIWNQPFDSVDQKTKLLTGDDAAKILKDQFNLTGQAAAGKKLYEVDTDGNYGVEAGDEYEGAATHDTRHWKSYILTDATGKAVDGKWAPDSDEPPEYIWRPDRTGNFTGEAAFFRKLITQGVPEAKVTAFESAIAALPQGQQATAAQKASLVAKFKGIAAAYPPGALDAKLGPLGLKASDF